KTDAARYTSEGHLKDLVRQHGLSDVWEAVAAVIDSDPTVLTRTTAQRDEERTRREQLAEQLASDALTAFKRNDLTRATQLINEAELVDPAYRTGRSERRPYGISWDEIRDAVRRRQTETTPAGQHEPDPLSPGEFDAWLATQPSRLRDGL